MLMWLCEVSRLSQLEICSTLSTSFSTLHIHTSPSMLSTTTLIHTPLCITHLVARSFPLHGIVY